MCTVVRPTVYQYYEYQYTFRLTQVSRKIKTCEYMYEICGFRLLMHS